MRLELISFKLCPFVQSSVITLLYRQVDYTVTYIDLTNPPLWFEELSPTGQVPLLKVDDQTVIFESAVINEYLDEISGGGMMPDTPLGRATNRAWTSYGGGLLSELDRWMRAKDDPTRADAVYEIEDRLDRLESIKPPGHFFNGQSLALIDTIYAALFMRLDLLKDQQAFVSADQLPRLTAWSNKLLGLDCVIDSVSRDFAKRFSSYQKPSAG